MKKFISITLALVLSAAVYAEEVDRTVDAAPGGHVHVSNIAGSVTVEGWSQNTVRVTGTLGRNVEELIVEPNDEEVIIKVKVPRHGGRGIDSDLRIRVPENSSIDVGTVSADIEVSDIGGEQKLHSVSGDVTTKFVGSDMSAETVSGDVEIHGEGDARGSVRGEAVSGDVTLYRVSGEAKADTVSGNVTIDGGSFERGHFEAVNGTVMFHGGLDRGGDLKFDAVNGKLDVELTGDVSAKINIETLNGGIDNCFGPEPRRTSKYGPGRELRFTEGDGEGRIYMETVNGRIRLCKD